MWEVLASTPWSVLYALDFLAFSSFALSYYFTCYRKGYRIDFWHMQLFFICVLPNMIMLPFAKSDLNQIVLGRDLDAVVAAIPTIFWITLVGYVSMLVGGVLWRIRLGGVIRRSIVHSLEYVPRWSMMLMSARRILLLQTAMCMLLQAFVLGMYFSSSGFGFDLRSYTFANPTLRPVALMASNYSIIIGSHCLARYTETKERILLASTLLLAFGLLFFGARSNLLSIFISVLVCYMVKQRNRISIVGLSTIVIVIVGVGFYLGNVRAGQYSPAEFLASLAFLLLYGDNFADLRDFAWIYSSWDHIFWGGKTYLAALMAFIPRFISEFRDTWALGVATSTTVGFDPKNHPGLRPGSFGESYLNFGILGVIVVGLMLGVIGRRVDIDVKRALAPPHSSMMKAFASTMLLGIAGSFAVSAGFSGLYILGGVYLFTWLCLCVQRTFSPAWRELPTAR